MHNSSYQIICDESYGTPDVMYCKVDVTGSDIIFVCVLSSIIHAKQPTDISLHTEPVHTESVHPPQPTPS